MKSPLIVLSVLQCHTLLDDKYDAVDGNIVKFEAKESVTSLAKLLVQLHDNFSEYGLNETLYFYPCVGTTMYETRHICS